MTRGKKFAIMGVVGGGSTAAATATTLGNLSNSGDTEGLLEGVGEEIGNTPQFNTSNQEAKTTSQLSDPFSTGINWHINKGPISSIDYTYDSSKSPNVIQKDTEKTNLVFGEEQDKDYEHVKSFLRVSSSRGIYDNNQWRGSLSGFGSFSNTRTNRGFVTYNRLETTKDKKLQFTGVFYLLKKDSSTDLSGKVMWRKEVKKEDGKKIDANNFNKYFPRPNWYSYEGQFHKVWRSNGNFIGGVKDLNNICEAADADCTGLTHHKAVSGYALYEGSGSPGYDGGCNYLHYGKYCDSVYQGTDNYDNDEGIPWGNYMYRSENDESKGYDLRDGLDSFYRGYGKKV